MDRGKVVKGLECCFNPHSEHSCLCHCADCPYNPPAEEDWSQQCQIQLNRDALALIKEQEQMYLTLEHDWKMLRAQWTEQEAKIKELEAEKRWDEYPDTMGKW